MAHPFEVAEPVSPVCMDGEVRGRVRVGLKVCLELVIYSGVCSGRTAGMLGDRSRMLWLFGVGDLLPIVGEACTISILGILRGIDSSSSLFTIPLWSSSSSLPAEVLAHLERAIAFFLALRCCTCSLDARRVYLGAERLDCRFLGFNDTLLQASMCPRLM